MPLGAIFRIRKRMSDVLKTFCETTRKLSQLQKAVKEDLDEIKASQRAANELLVELQADAEARATLDGACYSVSVVARARRPQQSLEIIEKIEELWLTQVGSEWKELVKTRPEKDPLETLLDLSLGRTWPEPKIRKAFKVKKVASSSARIGDLPEVPASSMPLLESFLQAKEAVTHRLASVREEKKALLTMRKELEENARTELSSVPEDSFRKIQLTASEGQADCYYLKLKPAKKPPPPKVSFEKLRKLMKAWIDERFDTSLRDEFVETMTRKDVVQSMLNDVSELLKEGMKRHEAQRIYVKNILEDKFV